MEHAAPLTSTPSQLPALRERYPILDPPRAPLIPLRLAGLDARGDGNIFRYNTIEHNVGAAIRFGGHDIDGHVYGVDNEAYDNLMVDNAYAAIKLTVGGVAVT